MAADPKVTCSLIILVSTEKLGEFIPDILQFCDSNYG